MIMEFEDTLPGNRLPSLGNLLVKMKKDSALIANAVIADCDPALAPFLRAETEREADRCLERLQREFIAPAVYATLARELRRSEASTQVQLERETEEFRELDVIVSGRVAMRLLRLRAFIIKAQNKESEEATTVPTEPIARLSAYAASAARHAIIDYLRRKRPGRRSLDTALQAAFALSKTLACWRVLRGPDFEEVRCGKEEWREVNVVLLQQHPDLQNRLRQELHHRKPADALQRVFDIVSSPLLYDDLLNFLADLWDVEAPYRAAREEYSRLRAPRLTATPAQEPERVAVQIGTLNEVWALLRTLAAPQAAVLLLHLPAAENGNFINEFIRLGVASEDEVARVAGLRIEELRRVEPSLPLEDHQIATLLGIEFDDVRRIRQDARRRLTRLLQRRQRQDDMTKE